MEQQQHVGSFQKTSLRRVAAFLGVSLGLHLVLLFGTSIGYLLSLGSEEDGSDDGETTEQGDSGGGGQSGSEAAENGDAGDGADSTIPDRTDAKDAVDEYMKTQEDGGTTEQADDVGDLGVFE